MIRLFVHSTICGETICQALPISGREPPVFGRGSARNFFEKRGLTVTKIKVNQERQTAQNMYLHKHGVFWPDDEQSPRIIGCRKPPMLKTDKLSRKLA
jgi:hypothetical protein